MESGGPGHELYFERSGWEKRGICKRLPRFSIFPGLKAESSPPCSISTTALVRNRNELRCLLVEGWPMPLARSPGDSEGREPCVGQGCAHPRMCLPHVLPGAWHCSGVSKRLAGWLPTSLRLPEHPPPPDPGRRLAASPRLRPLSWLLVFGQSVNGAPWTPDTAPPRSEKWGTAHVLPEPPPKPGEGRK